jgi:hypothetical protein
MSFITSGMYFLNLLDSHPNPLPALQGGEDSLPAVRLR